MNVKKAATELIKKYNTRDPFKIAEYLGLKVFFFPFNDIKGLIISFGSSHYIGINSNLPYQEQKFVLAHEIGHHQLHSPNYNYFFIRDNTHFINGKYERQANLFAFFLLTDYSLPAEVGALETSIVREVALKHMSD